MQSLGTDCFSADTGYNIDWKKNFYLVVLVRGARSILDGIVQMHQTQQEGANGIIDDDMYIYPNRDVKIGEEAFFFYGKKRDVIDNLKQPEKKRGRRKRNEQRRERTVASRNSNTS